MRIIEVVYSGHCIYTSQKYYVTIILKLGCPPLISKVFTLLNISAARAKKLTEQWKLEGRICRSYQTGWRHFR